MVRVAPGTPYGECLTCEAAAAGGPSRRTSPAVRMGSMTVALRSDLSHLEADRRQVTTVPSRGLA